MTSPNEQPLRLLLDEHYPEWLAAQLRDSGVDAVTVASRDDLRSQDDAVVLRVAAQEGRVVVTEDVTTFSIAIAAVPGHVGVVFCHHARFPRTKPGLHVLCTGLLALSETVPPALRGTPFEWWLAAHK